MSGEQRKLALVIGIGNYENGKNLENTVNDATDICSALENIGFITDGPHLNLNAVKMEIEIVKFKRKIKQDDIVLFYFAGHGTQWKNCNYLIPSDNIGITEKNIEERAINAENTIDDFIRRSPFVTVFLLDCCRTDPAEDSRAQTRGDASNSVGLHAMHAKAGCVIAFACAPGTVASDGKEQRNGLFTKHLLKHIGKANEDIMNVLRDVTEGVMDESNSKQIPFQSVSLKRKNVYLNEQLSRHFARRISYCLDKNSSNSRKDQGQSKTMISEIVSNDNRYRLVLVCKSHTQDLQHEIKKVKALFRLMDMKGSFDRLRISRGEIKLHPQLNCIFSPDHVYWTGPLRDGNGYGGLPYYCAVGWKKYSLYIDDDLAERYKRWCVCYHGTKFAFGLSILLSGLKPPRISSHGNGISTTPSIVYASHPRFAEVKRISSDHKNIFKSGQYIQYVLECRVNPKHILKIASETLGAKNVSIDPQISNNSIEWVIDNLGREICYFNDPDSPIVCTGIMIRVTDEHPGLLPESYWWYKSHLCENSLCCNLGMDLHQLDGKQRSGVPCNIIYE